MAVFRLSKWYLDCVTDAGDASIAYAGAVEWGRVHFRYASVLESTAHSIKTRHSLRERNEPQVSSHTICWHAPALRFDAQWQADSRELRETIFESDDGSVTWLCLMPRAHTQFGDRLGLGYAEQLTLTLPPWKLPLETLRWGRFLSASEWVVWIDWQGPFARRIVYRNGKQVETLMPEDGAIQFMEGSLLTLDRSLVLRNGPLGTTTLAGIPGLNRSFAARLLQVNECKWRSRARLESPHRPPVEGWAIHERVTWPK